MWTEERVNTLKSLWEQGLSGSQIARELGEGCTRNAVIGKADRLGLAGRCGLQRQPRSVSGPRGPRVRVVLPPQLRIVAQDPVTLADGTHIGLLALTDRTCRFPIGDPLEPDFHYCGHTPKQGSPYCEPHGQHMHQPTAKLTRRQVDRQATYYERGAVAHARFNDVEPEIAA